MTARKFESRTPEHAVLKSKLASIAAHESWAKTDDWTARTEPGRQAFNDRFEREVDPDGTMDPAIRRKRAAAARSAYFKRLALKRWSAA